ncbi:MAG: hypothetical protein ABI298_07260 [Acidimicrobiales bacterium]
MDSIHVILWPKVFALKEQLNLWSQIGRVVCIDEDRVTPAHANGRISSINPILSVTFTDGEVEAPRIRVRWAAPHIIFLDFGSQRMTIP